MTKIVKKPKAKKSKNRKLEFSTGPGFTCNGDYASPHAGDLLLVNPIFMGGYNSQLVQYDLQIGGLVKPLRNSKVTGWYKLVDIKTKEDASDE
jgi:hypothetical protein